MLKLEEEYLKGNVSNKLGAKMLSQQRGTACFPQVSPVVWKWEGPVEEQEGIGGVGNGFLSSHNEQILWVLLWVTNKEQELKNGAETASEQEKNNMEKSNE